MIFSMASWRLKQRSVDPRDFGKRDATLTIAVYRDGFHMYLMMSVTNKYSVSVVNDERLLQFCWNKYRLMQALVQSQEDVPWQMNCVRIIQ